MFTAAQRTIARLYIAVAVIAIVPIWCVRYLPTVDGPSHVYNSWILKELIRGAQGPIAEWFTIGWLPHPNWIGHAVMALLMFVVSPIIAEKLFVTGIVVLFLYAMWRYTGVAGEERRIFAFLAVPFAYSLLLQNGFYNICAGAALYFLILAVWWRRRDRPDARTITLIASLLLLCYFSHALPCLLAVGSLGLLWLMTLRGRRLAVHARHLIAFLPVMPLLIWFAPVAGAYVRGQTKRGELLRFIAQMRILYWFDRRQLAFGTAIAIILAILLVLTFVRRRWRWSESDAFLVVALVIAALYVASQSATSDVQDRLALFVALSPLAVLDLRLPPRATIALGAAFAVLAVAYCGYIIGRYRTLGGYMARFVASGDAIGERTTFLPVLYEIAPPDTVPIYSHAIDYVAIKKQSVDITNYEPYLSYFPIRWQPQVEPLNILALANPSALNLAAYAAHAQYIFIWRMDVDPGLPAKVPPFYTLVTQRGRGSVYCTSAAMADRERILLPLLGSTIDRGGPAGMFWRVEQSVRNSGPAPVTLLLSACEPQCRVDLAPGASAPIAFKASYAWVSVARSDADHVEFATTLRRVDAAASGAAVSVPAVREREFRDGQLEIHGVPFADPFRVALRVWTLGEQRPPTVLVTLRDAGGRILATKSLAIDGDGAEMDADLVHGFANAPQRLGLVTVTVAADNTKLWAFVSAIDPSVAAPALHFPD